MCIEVGLSGFQRKSLLQYSFHLRDGGESPQSGIAVVLLCGLGGFGGLEDKHAVFGGFSFCPLLLDSDLSGPPLSFFLVAHCLSLVSSVGS